MVAKFLDDNNIIEPRSSNDDGDSNENGKKNPIGLH